MSHTFIHSLCSGRGGSVVHSLGRMVARLADAPLSGCAGGRAVGWAGGRAAGFADACGACGWMGQRVEEGAGGPAGERMVRWSVACGLVKGWMGNVEGQAARWGRDTMWVSGCVGGGMEGGGRACAGTRR